MAFAKKSQERVSLSRTVHRPSTSSVHHVDASPLYTQYPLYIVQTYTRRTVADVFLFDETIRHERDIENRYCGFEDLACALHSIARRNDSSRENHRTGRSRDYRLLSAQLESQTPIREDVVTDPGLGRDLKTPFGYFE